MPIYEFRCDCGQQFEKLCRMNEEATVHCPKCNKETRRIMSLFRTGGGGGNGAISGSSGGGCGSCSSSSCSSC